MTIATKFEFLRLKEIIQSENLLMIISSCRKISDDITKNSRGNISINSTNCHSVEYDLDTAPEEYKQLKPREIIPLSQNEYEDLVKLYKIDKDAFLNYGMKEEREVP